MEENKARIRCFQRMIESEKKTPSYLFQAQNTTFLGSALHKENRFTGRIQLTEFSLGPLIFAAKQAATLCFSLT